MKVTLPIARGLLTLVLIATLLTPFGSGAPAAAANTVALANDLRISQAYGGGGGSTSYYQHDYVELFNAGAAPVNLTGWSLQYGSSTGNFASTGTNLYAFPANTIMASGQYLLVQLGTAGSGGIALPVIPDLVTTNLNMSATSGKVALANIATALGCGASATPCALPDARIVDLAAWGESNNAEGGVTINNGGALTNQQGGVRKVNGCQDTDHNGNDFDVLSGAALLPRNSASPIYTCPISGPAISLSKTVGTDSTACATTDDIAVPAGTEVTYCYEVTNTGTVALDYHDLEDSELGWILEGLQYTLVPGASAFVTETAVINVTTVNSATWTAYNADYMDLVMATDIATVTIALSDPAIVLAKTVGTDPLVCATTDEITVPAGTDVTYCYEVTNTSDVTLNFHDLVDSELGTLLSGFNYVLPPGASAFLTETTTINVTTVNTAIWTAYNVGPTDVVTATDVATVTVLDNLFCNVEAILIPGEGTAAGPAAPYPSDILVSGLDNAVTNVRVYLYNMNHTWPDDIDILLVGPQGQNLIIMSDAGGSFNIENVDLIFDDAASGQLPDNAEIVSGVYLPTNYGTGDTFPTPAPIPSTATQLAVFNGSNPNGVWSLFVYDDTGGDVGNINGGWCVEIYAEQVALPPNIDVDPLSMSSTQPANTTTQQTLDISNTGEADLTWTILEEPAAMLGRAAPGAVGSRTATFEGGMPLAYTSMLAFSEGFDDITALPGWYAQNNSAPLGIIDWFQGNSGVFSAHAGATNAYIAANYNNTAGVGTISNWLLTPELELADGETFSFWTRTTTGSIWADRLEVRLSTNGDSTNVGTLATDVGDFVTLLLSVNPDLISTGYPQEWTQFSVTLSGIPSGATGRFAFRYFVTDGGPNGSNSNYIGIDTVEYTGNLPPQICDLPTDVPWLAVSPDNGTTLGGATTPVAVTFDSTGLSAGTYNANLCITSNDPDPGPGNETELVIVPVELVVTETLEPSILITKTVGLVDGVCAATTSLEVPAGTTVYYCYTVTNTGNVTLTHHDLVDDVLGVILEDYFFPLAPGESVNTVAAGLSIPAVIDTTTTNTAVWTATDPTGGFSATASASATVIVASIEIVKTVGTVDGVCAGTSEITVPEGTTVYYCYTVTNTGDVTLNLHDLDDDVLGTILSGFNFALAPGASVNTVAAGLSIPYVANASVTNTATWTAYNANGPSVTATATATVNVEPTAVSVTRLAASPAGGWSSVALLGVFALGGFTWKRKRR